MAESFVIYKGTRVSMAEFEIIVQQSVFECVAGCMLIVGLWQAPARAILHMGALGGAAWLCGQIVFWARRRSAASRRPALVDPRFSALVPTEA